VRVWPSPSAAAVCPAASEVVGAWKLSQRAVPSMLRLPAPQPMPRELKQSSSYVTPGVMQQSVIAVVDLSP